ncbi:MAG TPA: OST-HTH/LOTUS domain-containing protein [Pyrinomonadaceae bacterium]|nr:OST-HTH/LOTUS domain-containing protein [Pyrinomonadaceae bacterium]
MFPEKHIRLEALADAAFKEWAPEAAVSYKTLKQGHSGDLVWKADVRRVVSGGLEAGQYILKLGEESKWRDQSMEVEAHQRAASRNDSFSRAHIPTLVRSFASLPTEGVPRGYAMLYEIAGRSFDIYATTDARESAAFLEISKQLNTEILDSWIDREPLTDQTPHELLREWLGYRLIPSEAPELHTFVDETMGEGLLLSEAGEVILNPIMFCDFAKNQEWPERGFLKALLHCDLHGGNVLAHRIEPRRYPYWIIDFGLSSNGPAGYDQAYLEVAQIISCLSSVDPAYLIGVLKSVDLKERVLLPDGTFWLKDCILKLRESFSQWRDAKHPRRIDDVNRQFCLARVAAGINWANKKLTSNQKYLALCYAGWAAREYLRCFEPEDYGNLWLQQKRGNAHTTDSKSNEANTTDQQLLKELWSSVHSFSARASKFILVAEGLGDNPSLRALGQLPWSVVIDLDPYSDERGLHRHAATVLQSHRSLHTFSQVVPPTEFNRGTAWMMAAGWSLKGESPSNYEEWKWKRLHLIRTFIKTFEEAIDPDPIKVIVLPGATLDSTMPMARVTKIVGAIEEMTSGRAGIYLLGSRPLLESMKHVHIPIDSVKFIEFLETVFGFRSNTEIPQIPGADGEWRTIPLESLRAMQENLEVLHSNVLATEPSIASSESTAMSFWRGRPPTWSDFQAGDDIERSIHTNLIRSLRKALTEGRQHTVILRHNPGAGGTTAALRAAWDLHWEFPTVILTHYSEALSVRLQNLSAIAQKTVLLVADATDLPETSREDLYRDLAQRNSRIVLLYIRRVFQADYKAPLALYDPMEENEARDFYDVYSKLIDDDGRRQELHRITSDGELKRYRSPFFYGLITFGHDFLPIDRYVSSHLKDARGKAAEVMKYLALLTIYSNTGLHEVLLRRLMGLSGDLMLELPELLGEGAARLVTSRNGRIRLMHQVIAEEVLTHLSGGEKDQWKFELHHLCSDLIRDVTNCVNPDSEMVLEMFRQLFTDRYGTGVEGVEDRQDFSPLIEEIDLIDRSLGHRVLTVLTEQCKKGAHFWNHLGRHQIYRMGRDPERAEQYLEEAVKLSPNDHIHYHTLGLVRRSRLRKLMKSFSNVSATEILTAIQSSFDSAIQAFEKSRAINPENIYSYITHVQTILETVDELRVACGVKSIGQLPQPESELVEWVESNVAIAEGLLNDTQQLYGTLEQQDTYLTDCYTKLEKLYGDIDEVIRLWELANLRTPNSAIGRRALANAYLARNERRWSTMQLSELRRILDLMDANLRSTGRRDEDYRLWFEAYKLIPEFDAEEAISKLHIWASYFPSWRAYYYVYIIQFLLWFSGRTDNTDEMDEAIERCQKYIIGRKNFSSQWLSYRPSQCPLVSEADLSPWNKKEGFWEDSSSLRAINGVTDDPMIGPQAGWVLIGGKVRAFFVPAKDAFTPNQDENKPVHFYVGFSPVGLRAWKVSRDRIDDGDRVNYGQAETFNLTTYLQFPTIPDAAKAQRLKSLQTARVVQFIDEFLRIKSELAVEVTLDDIEKRIEATFGLDGLIKHLGFESLQKLLLSLEGYELLQVNGRTFVRSASSQASGQPIVSHRQPMFGQIVMFNPAKGFGFIDDGMTNRWFRKENVRAEFRKFFTGRGQLVEFLPELTDRGEVAIGIKILDDRLSLRKREIIQYEDLGEAVKSFVISILSEGSEKSLSIPRLSRRLDLEFRGSVPVLKRLGEYRLVSFLKKIEGVQIEGAYPDLMVRLRDARSFGRLPRERSSNLTERGAKLTLESLTKLTIEVVRDATSKRGTLTLAELGSKLKTTCGELRPVLGRFGYKSLSEFVHSINELNTYRSQNGTDHVGLKKSPADDIQELSTQVHLASNAEFDGGPPLLEMVRDFIIANVDDAHKKGERLRLITLVNRVRRRFKHHKLLAQEVGYKNIWHLVATICDVDEKGVRSDQVVERKQT